MLIIKECFFDGMMLKIGRFDKISLRIRHYTFYLHRTFQFLEFKRLTRFQMVKVAKCFIRCFEGTAAVLCDTGLKIFFSGTAKNITAVAEFRVSAVHSIIYQIFVNILQQYIIHHQQALSHLRNFSFHTIITLFVI